MHQPPWNAPVVKLAASVWTHPQYDVQPIFLRQMNEFGNVGVSGEVELVGVQLVVVPGYVELDRVQTTGFHFGEAVIPVAFVNPEVVDGSGDVSIRLAIFEKTVVLVIDDETALGLFSSASRIRYAQGG